MIQSMEYNKPQKYEPPSWSGLLTYQPESYIQVGSSYSVNLGNSHKSMAVIPAHAAAVSSPHSHPSLECSWTAEGVPAVH